jgi:hypothetical protein
MKAAEQDLGTAEPDSERKRLDAHVGPGVGGVDHLAGRIDDDPDVRDIRRTEEDESATQPWWPTCTPPASALCALAGFSSRSP